MRMALRSTVWFGAYITVIVLPLYFAAVGVGDSRDGFWHSFAVALGFVGLSMLGLQFVLVARLQTMAEAFGEDALAHFHRYMGYAGTAFIFAHPLLLISFVNIGYIDRLNPFTANWAGRLGTFSIACLLVVIATSIWRKSFRISYEVWQATHLILSTLAAATALAHVELIGHYVNQPWKRVLWVAMTMGFVLIFAWVRIVRPVIRMRRRWSIESVKPQAGGVNLISLKPIGHAGFTFAPGQFGWLTINRSPFAITQHPFSFSSDGDDPAVIEMSIKELGDFTSTIKTIPPGTVAYLDGPHGVFSPDYNEGPGFVFVAGGVGIGPIRSMLRTLQSRGDRRPCYLFYGTNTIADTAFLEELAVLAKSLDLKIIVVVAKPDDDWSGEQGYVDSQVLHRNLPSARRDALQYFICGPEPMQNAVEEALVELGVPGHRIHTERFNFV